ncbi:MAG: hypothetical protein AAB781_02025 [Patescibacteria group bacterium]
MKSSLIFYLPFVFIASIYFLTLRSEGKAEQPRKIGQIQNNIKKIIVIETEEFEPFGRVICKTANGNRSIFTDWMSAKDAVIAKAEMVERYRNNSLEIFIEYDKYLY